MRRLAGLVVAGALALAGCGDDNGGGLAQQGASEDAGERRTPTTRVEVIESITQEGGFDAQRLYTRDAPGVVTITAVFGEARGALGGILGGEGGGNGGGEGGGEGGGQGSGFVVNDRGEIVTNAHVVTQGEDADIRKAREVYVEFADANRVPAKIVGFDPNADLALLRIEPKGLTLRPLPLGSSREVEVGQPVAAIGSPFGERQSLSVGVVSALDRAIEGLTDFAIAGAVQTDAAINPGNSGGPLVNAAGEVIGVNQSIRTASGGGEGVGFAVPVDTVKRSIEQLRGAGKVGYAYLGVTSAPLYPQLAERFDLPVDRGAWIQDVTSDGPADKAGIKGGGRAVRFQAQRFNPGGDVVTRIEDVPVRTADDLSEAIAPFDPGTEVEMEIYRDGRKQTIDVKLGERPLEPPSG